MILFTPSDYGPTLSQLVDVDRRRPLDAGRPDASRRARLEQTASAGAFSPATIVDGDMADCCRAGLWLLHDFLDESHRISQDVETPSGSFWHGVMHRREGDYSNAKYWFRRVGAHAVLDRLGAATQELGAALNAAALAARIAPRGVYDPFAMVDACQESVRAPGASQEFCRRVQQAEWEALFDFCYCSATGT
ncbi:MAG: hypothetical protein IT424_00610 [Pirellulales bacterium]|nr:hypothetical protein [Pirellulales bacterium]